MLCTVIHRHNDEGKTAVRWQKLHKSGTMDSLRKGVPAMVHIAKLNGRLCGAKRPHSVSEQPNFYQSLQSNPYNDSSHPSGGE